MPGNISQLFRSGQPFQGQLQDESTSMVLRMHWVFLLGILIAFLFLFLLPFVLYFFLSSQLLSNNSFFGYWLLVFIYLLMCWGGLFYRLMLYVLNVWIVTDHRIIASEQHGLFKRTLAELTIVKIQDVEVRISGLFSTFLNFGDVRIQSAGEEENFLFKNVADPAAVKDVIIKAQRHFLASHHNNQEPDGV